jgi:hypothetical protein
VGGGLVCGLDAAGCVELYCLYVQVWWWFSLWIECCWLCSVTLFIGTGGVVVYFVEWMLLVV